MRRWKGERKDNGEIEANVSPYLSVMEVMSGCVSELLRFECEDLR